MITEAVTIDPIFVPCLACCRDVGERCRFRYLDGHRDPPFYGFHEARLRSAALAEKEIASR
jgi:hypothetical protein